PSANVDVLVLPSHANHLLRPGKAYMPGHDLQLWESQGDLVEVRHRPARLRRHQRPGVTDLRTERDVQLDAFDIERKVELVVRGAIPQPRHDAQRFEAQFFHRALQFAHGLDWFFQVDCGDADD